METILFIKLILAAIGAGIVLWYLFIRGDEEAEGEVRRRLRQDHKEQHRVGESDPEP